MASNSNKLYRCQQVLMEMQAEANHLKQELATVRKIYSIASANRDKILDENEELKSENEELKRQIKDLERRG